MATCLHPTNVKGVLYPCGRCPVCLQNKRQSLSNRFMLESAFTKHTYFITLTYDEDNIPMCIEEKNGVFSQHPCFDKKQVVNFFKRLRKNYGISFRKFLTCEYGKLGNRPHYHILIWLDNDIGLTHFKKMIESTWPFGFVQVSMSSDARIAYAAKYALKDDYRTLSIDKHSPRKPFRLFSSRPGIGSSALPFINDYIYNGGKIRNQFVYNGKSINFDTYLKRHIDPSLLAEIQFNSYYSPEKYYEIQKSLQKSRLKHSKEITDIDGNKKLISDFTRDKEIIFHRETLKSLKGKNRI